MSRCDEIEVLAHVVTRESSEDARAIHIDSQTVTRVRGTGSDDTGDETDASSLTPPNRLSMLSSAGSIFSSFGGDTLKNLLNVRVSTGGRSSDSCSRDSPAHSRVPGSDRLGVSKVRPIRLWKWRGDSRSSRASSSDRSGAENSATP